MGTSWMLLLLCVFHQTVSREHCQCKDIVNIIKRATLHDNVTVSCPSFTGTAMTFTLFKGSAIIATKSTNQDLNTTGEKISLRVNKVDNKTSFVLNNVTVDQTGLYTCEAQKIFPPPLVPIKDQPQTIVIVEEPPHHARYELPLWVGFGVLVTYSLIITYIAVALRSRIRQKDIASHDYINMKPRVRVRRKNQGVHLPPRLSWYNDPTTSTGPCNKHPSKQTTH